ncbi:MAG: hypothetical protein RLZZ121_140, partial [Bacteroidota bacterium]
ARLTYRLWDFLLPRSVAAVTARDVAAAMLLDSLKDDQGNDLYDSHQIKVLAGLLPR